MNAASEADDLAGLCAALDGEPLFHASLGSRELFHSNMLEWFTSHHREAAAQVFDTWTIPAPGTEWQRTQREWRHLDLVVHLADRAPLVIENKVFSPPYDGQLARYTEDLDAAAAAQRAFALLSLVAPSWPDGTATFGTATWRYHSYEQLADALDDALDLVPGGYARETVGHYSLVIRTLHTIAGVVNEAITPDSDIRLSETSAATLHDVRLDQGFEKLRTRTIAYRLADHLTAHGYKTKTLKDGYTRSWPLLEWFLHVPGTQDELGWQLQEGQWRLVVRVTPDHDDYGKGDAVRARREAYVADRYARWFDFTAVDEILGTSGPVDPSPGSFKGFAPDFVYLYRRPKTLKVEQLCELATAIAEHAQQWTS